MKKFLTGLFSADDPDVSEYVKKEYGWYMVITGLYVSVKTFTHMMMTFIQGCLYTGITGYHVVLFATTGVLMLREGKMLGSVRNIYYVCIYIIGIIWYWNVYLQRSRLTRLFRASKDGLYRYDNDVEMFREEINKPKEKLLRFLSKKAPPFFNLSITILALVSPGLHFYTKKHNFENIYSPTGVSLNLGSPMWVPFGTDSTLKIIICMIIRFCGGMPLGLTHFFVLIILADMSQTVCAELALLKKSLDLLSERTVNLFRKRYGNRDVNFENLRYDKQLEECCNLCLKENAIHYQQIISIFKDVRQLLIVPFTIGGISSAVIIASACSTFVFGRNEANAAISSGILGAFQVLFIFTFSWMGETIKQANENLQLSLYNTRWIYFTKSNATNLRIIMLRASRPFLISADGLWAANYETFSLVLNTAYSYFNLILASK